MKISLPNISILKMEDKCRFIGIIGGLHSSLGVYGSVQEGVCSILDKGRLKVPFRIQLEHLWLKGEEMGWDEDKLFDPIHRKVPDRHHA